MDCLKSGKFNVFRVPKSLKKNFELVRFCSPHQKDIKSKLGTLITFSWFPHEIKNNLFYILAYHEYNMPQFKMPMGFITRPLLLSS